MYRDNETFIASGQTAVGSAQVNSTDVLDLRTTNLWGDGPSQELPLSCQIPVSLKFVAVGFHPGRYQQHVSHGFQQRSGHRMCQTFPENSSGVTTNGGSKPASRNIL